MREGITEALGVRGESLLFVPGMISDICMSLMVWTKAAVFVQMNGLFLKCH